MKQNKWIILLVALSIIGTALLYPYLPEQVPAHWNIRGEVDRYQDKPWVFFMALLPLVLYLLMIYLPKIDPKKASYEMHKKPYRIIQLLIVIVFILLHWASMVAALGSTIDIGVIVRLIVGVLFIIMGNYMSQIRQNYFLGIKTPWTLHNEQVWKKTHRVGAYGFTIMGIVTILTIFLSGKISSIIMAAGTLGLVIFLFLYSYLEYKKIIK